MSVCNHAVLPLIYNNVLTTCLTSGCNNSLNMLKICEITTCCTLIQHFSLKIITLSTEHIFKSYLHVCSCEQSRFSRHTRVVKYMTKLFLCFGAGHGYVCRVCVCQQGFGLNPLAAVAQDLLAISCLWPQSPSMLHMSVEKAQL